MHFTQNPIGSDDQLDLQDNAISFDYAMNSPAALWQDRFGKQHKTVQQALKDVGFKPAGFDFVSGGTLGLGDRDKCVFYPTDGYWYSWNGQLPYVVTANSSPTPGGKKGWGVVTRDERVLAREALRRTYLEAGYNLVEGSFEQGGVLLSKHDVLLHETSGLVYGWVGLFPQEGKNIAVNSTPDSTGGVTKTTWREVSGYILPGAVAFSSQLRFIINGKITELVSDDPLFSSVPRVIISVPTSANQYGGYDIVTDTGIFEFITPTNAVMRGKNGFPTNTQYINPIGWGANTESDATSAFKKALEKTGCIFVSEGTWVLSDTIFKGGKDLRITMASKNAILVNNVPNGKALIEYLNTGTSYSVDIHGGRVDSVINKNIFIKMRKSVLSFKIDNMDFRGGYQLFDIQELYGNPTISNIHVRNLAWDAGDMSGSFVLRAESCNTLSCDNWSVTGAYENGIYSVQSDTQTENWNNSFTNITMQGRGSDNTFGIGQVLTVTGGSCFVRNWYTEKTRPSEKFPIRLYDLSGDISGLHLVNGSVLFTRSNITLSSPDLISVAGTGPEVTQIKSDNSVVVITTLNNFNDYAFRFEEESSGKIKVLGNTFSANTFAPSKTPVNAGAVGTGVTLTDQPLLTNIGLPGAVLVKTTDPGTSGIKFALSNSSDPTMIGEKYTLVFRIKIVQGKKVSVKSLSGFSGRNPVIPCPTYQDQLGKWMDIVFHGTINNTNGAACSVVIDGAGEFYVSSIAFHGHVSM